MNFCSECGHAVSWLIPPGEDRERFVCEQCNTIHYQNPRIITGCLPVYENKVLLCKRAIEPRHGLWTLPAGFMENGETSEQGALRESWEEAQVKLEVHHLYTLFNLPYINQLYLFYYASMPEPEYAPGTESLEVELFSQEEIPWDQLAFPVVERTLRYYFADKKQGEMIFRTESIDRRHH